MSDQINTEPAPMRMDAYYYGFTPTGVDAIDRILCAVASAGRSFHNTEDWNNECGESNFSIGNSPVEWIQNAANAAALLQRENE